MNPLVSDPWYARNAGHHFSDELPCAAWIRHPRRSGTWLRSRVTRHRSLVSLSRCRARNTASWCGRLGTGSGCITARRSALRSRKGTIADGYRARVKRPSSVSRPCGATWSTPAGAFETWSSGCLVVRANAARSSRTNNSVARRRYVGVASSAEPRATDASACVGCRCARRSCRWRTRTARGAGRRSKNSQALTPVKCWRSKCRRTGGSSGAPAIARAVAAGSSPGS